MSWLDLQAHTQRIQKDEKTYDPPYSLESVPIALRRICREDTSTGAGAAAVKKSCRPTLSDMVRTREETVAPSRRFLLSQD